jgi:nitroreductase
MHKNETLKTIKERRSIRNYKENQIKDEQLETIVEAALYAPYTGWGKQDLHFTVIQNKNILDKLAKIAMELARKKDFRDVKFKEGHHWLYKAPTLIMLSCNKNCPCPEINSTAAAQNMLLAAESIGLGGCFIYYVVQALELDKNNVLLQEIKIPDEYKPCTTIIIGYKKSGNLSIPERKIEKINYH